MIQLPCYEPAGRVLELSPDDLTRHVIAFGSTGSRDAVYADVRGCECGNGERFCNGAIAHVWQIQALLIKAGGICIKRRIGIWTCRHQQSVRPWAKPQ